jgi:hypothetical protein
MTAATTRVSSSGPTVSCSAAIRSYSVVVRAVGVWVVPPTGIAVVDIDIPPIKILPLSF